MSGFGSGTDDSVPNSTFAATAKVERLSVPQDRVPRHVAIIMDGNGRWAKNRAFHRTLGHARGASKVKEIIREADRLGIGALTLYAFSTENWGRPVDEVSALMELLYDFLLREREEMMANGIRLRVFGQIERLPPFVRQIVEETIEITRANAGLQLSFCISYGARAELLRAVQSIARDARDGKLDPNTVSDADVEARLYTAGLPDPDLLIRTSGEFRLSNFLLWQLAYTEIYITDTLWPDFEPSHLRAACEAFAQRKRRFGLSDDANVLPASKDTP